MTVRRSIQGIRKDLQEKINVAGEYWTGRVPADMGNHSGTVAVPDTQSMVYVRLPNGQVMEVFNNVAPNIYNWKVYIGRDKSQPNLIKVLEARWIYNVSQTVAYVLFHHKQHEYPGPDTVWILSDQFMPLLVLPKTGFTVHIFGHTIYRPGMDHPITVEDQDLDTSAYAVTAGARYVILEVLSTGAINYVVGDTYGSRDVLHSSGSLPQPTQGAFPAVALEFFEGQTEHRRDSTERTIIDLRSIVSEVTASVGTQISEAEESLTIQDHDFIGFFESDGDSLKKIRLLNFKTAANEYVTKIYGIILQKFIDLASLYLGINAAAGGDLTGNYPNPEVYSIQGVVVDSNLIGTIADGDSLVYNGTTEQLEAGAGGGTGTPMVYDDLTSQIPAASDHFDLASEASGAVLLFYNTTMQSTSTFTMDGDNLGLTTSFSPVAGDTLIAVYGLSGSITDVGGVPPALKVLMNRNFTF